MRIMFLVISLIFCWSFLIRALPRLVLFRRIDGWPGWRTIFQHDGTPSNEASVFFQRPSPRCGVVLSAATTLRRRKRNFIVALLEDGFRIAMGCGWAWLGSGLVTEWPVWSQPFWYVTWVIILRCLVDRIQCSMTYVGSDGAAIIRGESNTRGTRGRVTQVDVLSVWQDIAFLQVQGSELFFAARDPQLGGDGMRVIRCQGNLTPQQWVPFIEALKRTFDEYNWSVAMLHLATTEVLADAQSALDLSSVHGIEFDISQSDRFASAWYSIEPHQRADVRNQGQSKIAYNARGVIFCPAPALNKTFVAASGGLEGAANSDLRDATATDAVSISQPLGRIGDSVASFQWEATTVEFQRFNISPVTIPVSHIKNGELLLRLLASRVWSDGLGPVITLELQKDESRLRDAGWQPKVGESPFGTILAGHRFLIWLAAKSLLGANLLTGVDAEAVEDICRTGDNARFM